MTILQINKFHYLRGGSERHVFELSRLLEAKGHKVMHFSMKDEANVPSMDEKYFINQVDLQKFSIKGILKYFYNYEAVRNLEKLLEENQVDIAHVHNIDGQIGAAIFSVLKKKNIPIVQTLHDYKVICPNAKLFSQGSICQACQGGKFYNCFLKKCAHGSRAKSFLAMLESYLNKTILKHQNSVDVYVAPSKFMKDACIDFGLPAGKIEVLRNFLNRQEEVLFNGKEEDYFLYFGRLAEEKGVAVLLEAVALTKIPTKLKIAGQGPERENLESQARELKIEDRVEFLGFKKQEELKEIIAKSRAIVMPSLWHENMPYSLIESLSAGKAVYVSRVGGMQEAIEDQKNGILFESGNPADLAQKIDQLSAVELNRIKAGAKESAKEFSSEKYYEKIEKIYQTLRP